MDTWLQNIMYLPPDVVCRYVDSSFLQKSSRIGHFLLVLLVLVYINANDYILVNYLLEYL
jgi:hypothetical protein